MKNGVVSCKWNVYVKLGSVQPEEDTVHMDAHMLHTAAKGNAPGFVCTCYRSFALRVWPPKRRAETNSHRSAGSSATHTCQDLIYSRVSSTKESRLTMWAHSGGWEQIPGSLWAQIHIHGGTGATEAGGTRHSVPVAGKSIWAVTVTVSVSTQGNRPTNATGPRRRPSFPILKWSTVGNTPSFP